MKKVLGVDLDNVLMDFNAAMMAHHNTHHGTSYVGDDVTTTDLADIWQCTAEECFDRVNAFYCSSHHEEALPEPGAPEITQRLAEKHDLYVITSRPQEVETYTKSWLDRHFPNTFREVVFTNLFNTSNALKVSKADVCQRLGVDIFIDDFPHHVLDVSSRGVTSLLFDAPCNKDATLPPHIKKVYSWKEILDIVENS